VGAVDRVEQEREAKAREAANQEIDRANTAHINLCKAQRLSEVEEARAVNELARQILAAVYHRDLIGMLLLLVIAHLSTYDKLTYSRARSVE
jgi:hypothetical protein